jgi:hypothetical protein
MTRNRCTLSPAEIVHQSDHTCSDRWSVAVRGLTQNNARDVLPRHPAFLVPGERAQFTAIQRECMDCNQCFGVGRRRFRNFT